MAQLTIQARPRSVAGKKVKALRRQGLLPANVYGHNMTSQAVELDRHAFTLLQRRIPANAILNLVVDGGATYPVMIHRTQYDVRSGLPIHIEFFRVNLLEKLTASIPLVPAGEAALVGRGEAILLQEMDAIEVSCLPGDLLRSIEVPLDRLTAVGDVIHVRDLAFDRTKLETKASPDDRVASLTAPQAYREEAAPAAPATPAPSEGGV